MEKGTITITETASDRLPADAVVISITAAGEAKTAKEAGAAAAEKAERAAAALKKAGFEARAARLGVNAKRDGKRVTGYIATRALSVELDYDGARLCAALDAIADFECEFYVEFLLKDKSACKSLAAKAVQNAAASAESIAAAAGVKLGRLVSAEYSGGAAARPMLLRAGIGSNAEPELITLSETVVCSWEIA